jgi:hypothetical protein
MKAMTKALTGLTIVAAAGETYRRVLREPALTWGATDEEARRSLPGDELLEDADIVSTRAITIDALPSDVFPWLLQMGSARAGAYTYDWIENLFGLGMRSSDRIHPEWQQLEVGDVIAGKRSLQGMRVELLEPERVLATRSEDGTWVWTFVLEERDGGTRFLSRNRIAVRTPSLADRLVMAAMEPGSLVMERKMLLGIRERAERLAAQRAHHSDVEERAPDSNSVLVAAEDGR